MKKPFKSFVVNKDFEGSRVDRFLKKQFPNIPQSLFEKNLRKKNIKVNQKKVKNLYKLRIDDIIDIFTELKIETKLNKKKSSFKIDEFKDLKKNFIFECEDYCILNKPYGYASQDGSKVKKNIIDLLNAFSKNYYIVHRLDKDTTGLMLLAKNRVHAIKFSEMFKLREVKKKYRVIINGKIKKNKGEIISKFKKDGKDLESKLYFEVLLKKNNFSYLEVDLITGRKHQIRKQLSDIGHPVVGDTKYGDKKNKIPLCLLSYEIEFKYKNKIKKYKATIPDNFKTSLEKFF
tara:strand:- start:7566 stop:8432 length:867 start_codon:yes stop_codon:yes gene_type:complete